MSLSPRARTALFAGAGVIALWLAIRACSASAMAPEPQAPAVAREAALSHELVDAVPQAEAPPVLPDEKAPVAASPVAMDPLTAYLQSSRYPPTSRPLSPAMDDLIHPNQRYETEQPAEADARVRFLFSADKTRVVGDEVLNAFLRVDRDGQPFAVKILSASASVDGAERAQLAFRGDDGLYTSSIAPATFFAERTAFAGRTAYITYAIDFEVGPGLTQQAEFKVMYTPEAAIPARFTGSFRDHIAEGSLVIEAGIDVRTPGHYLIDCNLYDARDEPIAWTRYTGTLTEDDRWVPLSFFGKVLVDSGAEPPFHIGELRGLLHVARRTPDKDSMAPFSGAYVTADYALAEFSAADWDSPHKRKKIEFLRSEIARGSPLARPPEAIDR